MRQRVEIASEPLTALSDVTSGEFSRILYGSVGRYGSDGWKRPESARNGFPSMNRPLTAAVETRPVPQVIVSVPATRSDRYGSVGENRIEGRASLKKPVAGRPTQMLQVTSPVAVRTCRC
jgi:hypothetical protein